MEQGQRAAGQATGRATLRFGVYTHEVRAGQTVAQAREEFSQLYDIPKDTQARHDKTVLNDNDQIAPDTVIDLIHRSGEKGS